MELNTWDRNDQKKKKKKSQWRNKMWKVPKARQFRNGVEGRVTGRARAHRTLGKPTLEGR